MPIGEGKYTLITNLDYVWVNGLRTNCHALLLEEEEGGIWASMHKPADNKRRQIRGFGPDAAWSVFDIDVKSLEFEIEYAESSAAMLRSDGTLKPLMSGATMKFKDGPVLILASDNQDHPIDAKEYPEGTRITDMWPDVLKNSARYWNAPAMPLLKWVSAETVRSQLGVFLPPRDRVLRGQAQAKEPRKLEGRSKE